jgi:hypothetical protein
LFAVSSVVGEVSAAEGASPAAQRVFRVGAAKVDFTPPEGEGIKLHGYDQRTEPFKGIHDRVHFRAIVLDDGQQQAAIVSADVALVVEKFWRMATEKIESELKIPR